MTKEEVIEKLEHELADDYGLSMRQWTLLMSALRMLKNATIWTPCTERMPTVEDADAQGFVGTQWPDGVPSVDSWEHVASGNHDYYAWSRIEAIGGGNG